MLERSNVYMILGAHGKSLKVSMQGIPKPMKKS